MMAESSVRPSAGGVARRRRERRLRSWWRHEQQTVRMALAAATHHSAQQNAAPRGPKTGARAREGVEHEQHDGLRAQKPPLPGVRPGSLFDPGPQRSDRSLRRSAGDGLPTPGLPVLAGASGEAVDASTLRFLAAVALYSRKLEEEEEEKKREEEEEEELMKIRNIPLNQLTSLQKQKLGSWLRKEKEKEKAKAAVGVLPSSSSSSSGFRRKRKKRRKRRLPRSPRPLLRGRARRRQRQWHVSLRRVVDVPVVRFVLFPQVLFCGFYADWISSNDEICAANFIYFRFKLKGKCRSEKWEFYLYGDKTIKVDRVCVEVFPRGVPPSGICGVGFGSSPYWPRITPSMSCACLLSVAWE